MQPNSKWSSSSLISRQTRRASVLKRETFVLVIALGIVALFAPSDSDALVLDNLKCFKSKDSAKFRADTTVSSVLGAFGVEDCTIVGKAKLFCIPVESSFSNVIDKSKPTLVPPEEPPSEVLTDGRLCYKIKCPKTEINPTEVTDPFGRRSLSKFKAQFVCTPASGFSQQFDIVMRLESNLTVGSLGFQVTYEAATGEFAGTGTSVQCEHLIEERGSLFFFAKNDDDAGRLLNLGMINTDTDDPLLGIPAPTDLVTCRFTTPAATVTAQDFEILDVSAADPLLNDIAPFVNVVISSITAVE